MPAPIYQVDSFTDEPFRGNPAGVCILDKPKDERWMQNVAKEMNLSETAFIEKFGEGYNLRWFTPKVEVDLCGHATLASAHILWSEGFAESSIELLFNTRSGILRAKMRDSWIELDFPATPATHTEMPIALIKALGVNPVFNGKTRFDYLIELETEDEVRKAAPNFELLKALRVRGVMITARSASMDVDFVSRFFAPGAGIDEDPVTGSAHCALAPYWSHKLGKSQMIGHQVSEREGIVKVRMGANRVYLLGKAVTVFKGELTV